MLLKFFKTSVFLLCNFFLFILIGRLLNLTLGIDIYVYKLLQIFIFIGGLYCWTHLKIIAFDIIIILYIIFLVLNGIVIDYNNHWSYLYNAIFSQLFPIFAYFIGRYYDRSTLIMFEKIKWPILFTIVFGLILFFTTPSWYIAMKNEGLDEVTSINHYMERFRLSAFWPHPYILAYVLYMYCVYLILQLNKPSLKKSRYNNTIILFVCIVVLFLCQMRVTIASLIMAYLYFIALSSSVSKKIHMILYILVLIPVFLYASTFLDSDLSNYISEHISNLFIAESYEDRFELTSGGMTDYSLFGEGLGRYDYTAREYGIFAIVDSEYQNHLAELGYIGITLLTAILSLTFFKGVFKKDLFFEFVILCFFILAMVGASVLSNHHQYNFIFWYAVGRIWSYKLQSQKKHNYILNTY